MSRGYKRFVNKVLHNFEIFKQIMQNSLGIIIKSFVIFKVEVVIIRFNNYYRKNSWNYAEKFCRNKIWDL